MLTLGRQELLISFLVAEIEDDVILGMDLLSQAGALYRPCSRNGYSKWIVNGLSRLKESNAWLLMDGAPICYCRSDFWGCPLGYY